MNKNILITGAGRGIGFAIAKRLEPQARNLILLTKTEKSLQGLKKEFPKAINFAFDLTKEKDLISFIKQVKSKISQLTQEFLSLFKKGKNPLVINISSAASFTRFPGESCHSAVKAGLTALSEVIREELQKDGIRFTAIQPYGVNTWNDPHPEDLLRPEDIAELVDYIINAHPNCQILTVNLSNVRQWRQGIPPWIR